MAKLPKGFNHTGTRKPWEINRLSGACAFPYSVLWEADGVKGTVMYRSEEMAAMFIEEMKGAPLERIEAATAKAKDLYSFCVRDRETGTVIDGFTTAYAAEQEIKKFKREDKKEGHYIENYYEIGILSDCMGGYMTYTESPIKTARQRAGMTQRQLAQATGSSIRTIQDWENRRRIPRDVYVLRDMARALGCAIEDLIE